MCAQELVLNIHVYLLTPTIQVYVVHGRVTVIIVTDEERLSFTPEEMSSPTQPGESQEKGEVFAKYSLFQLSGIPCEISVQTLNAM